ncbi:hypothetical protein R1flu_003361 [Riccia fluitans]|uniref:Uncharacterized protein n=1 Tax=Riccia fluitans TaxID=41844 RepID=A0ABD1Y8U8_9MARC
MAKKREIERTDLDEVERSLYGLFRGAVGSVTSLFSLQKQQTCLSYEAGKRQALQTLYRWIDTRNQQGSVMSMGEIVYHL